MAEPSDDLAHIPQAVTTTKRRSSLSLVWSIPLVAALIGGWLAVKTYLEKGPTITVSFATAEGLEANKTRVKLKDVEIGEVKDIRLAADRSKVLVQIELAKYVTPYLMKDSRFWVVRPRIGAGGVSGLGTLFSGAYIGMDVGKSTQPSRDYVGLEQQPIVSEGQPGRHFILHTQNLGSLGVGDPIYYRRIRAGAITNFELDKDGKGVTLNIFVEAPYDQHVTTDTRFWHASGVDVTLGADGLNIRTEALSTILVGGIAFQTPPSNEDAPRADPNYPFKLERTREEAMRTPDIYSQVFAVYFDQSVRGIQRGAPVEFKGVPIGEVVDASLEWDAKTFTARTIVTFRIYPERLWVRVRGDTMKKARTAKEFRANLDGLVARGMRAQLRVGNILTGQYFVAIDYVPDAKKAEMDWTKDPPMIPSVPGSIDALETKLASILEKLDKIPYAEISADVRKSLASLDSALKSGQELVRRVDADLVTDMKTTLISAHKALDAAQVALESANRVMEDGAPLKQDMREALRELTRAAEAIRGLADLLERHPEALLRGKSEEKQP